MCGRDWSSDVCSSDLKMEQQTPLRQHQSPMSYLLLQLLQPPRLKRLRAHKEAMKTMKVSAAVESAEAESAAAESAAVETSG